MASRKNYQINVVRSKKNSSLESLVSDDGIRLEHSDALVHDESLLRERDPVAHLQLSVALHGLQLLQALLDAATVQVVGSTRQGLLPTSAGHQTCGRNGDRSERRADQVTGWRGKQIDMRYRRNINEKCKLMVLPDHLGCRLGGEGSLAHLLTHHIEAHLQLG